MCKATRFAPYSSCGTTPRNGTSIRNGSRPAAARKVREFPQSPGVYLMKDAAGRVIYVGKAKNLRARVRSYFLETRLAEAKTDTLVRVAESVSTIIVDNEREERVRQAAMRRELRERLSSLPAPRNDYQIVVPELPEMEEAEEGLEEDAADAARCSEVRPMGSDCWRAAFGLWISVGLVVVSLRATEAIKVAISNGETRSSP